uniref:Uncharacterized protein n=1 Tax=Auxenochlorella protothecoides TaxID=3075 RepID=A0A1D2A4L2_AUXPR
MARGNEPAEGLLAAARLGLTDKLKLALDQASCDVVNAKDETGRTALHHAASCGYEDCVELLLERGADGSIQDEAGDTPLHLAAQAGLPMPSYQVCSKFPAACLAPDASGRTPVDLAVASSRGEVLNAMLLACSGSGSEAALASMRALLARGAVCDTWAPSGSSALMLVASADSRPGVELLLAHGATMELQDALGRTALMFAAGNGARGALGALLAAGASLSVRDRRGRNVLDYAGAGTPVRAALEERLRELETKSAALQEALLAEVLGEGVRAGGVQAAAPGAGKKAKKKAKKKGKGGVPGAKAAAAGPAVDGDAEEAEEAVVEACAAREGPAETGAAGDSGAAGDAGTAGEQAGAPAGETLVTCEPAPPILACPRSPRSPRSRSPGWCTVTKAAGPKAAQHAQQGSGAAVGGHAGARRAGGAAATLAVPMTAAAERGRSAAKPAPRGPSPPSAAARAPRAPSAASLASSSSGESHETDLSRSERSVLERAAVAAAAAAKGRAGGARAGPSLAPWAGVRAGAASVSDSVAAAFPPLSAAAAGDGDSAVAATVGGGGAAAARPTAVEPPTDMMGGPTGVADSPADPHAPLDPAATSSSEDEVALLRLQLASLQAALDRSELARRVEAAAAEEEAAAHAAALTKAVLAERMECVVRFASFLQNHGPAVLATMPELLGNGVARPGAPAMAGPSAPGGPLGGGRGGGPALDRLHPDFSIPEFASLGFPPPSASQTFGADAVPRPSPPLAFSGPMGRTSLDAAFQSPTHTLHSGFGAGAPPPSFMGHAPRYGGAEARTRGDPHALHPAGYPADGGNKPAPAFFTLNLGTTC